MNDEDERFLDYEDILKILKAHYEYQNNFYGHLEKFNPDSFHNIDIDLLNKMVYDLLEIEKDTRKVNFNVEDNINE